MCLMLSESPRSDVVLAGGFMLFSRRRVVLVLGLLLLLLVPLNASERERGPNADKPIRRPPTSDVPAEDCLQFNCESVPSEISAENVSQLEVAWRLALPDIADGAPIYVSNVLIDDGVRDLLILST